MRSSANLYWPSQVQLIWVMYRQSNSDDEDDEDNGVNSEGWREWASLNHYEHLFPTRRKTARSVALRPG
jgi:hypothetical protein